MRGPFTVSDVAYLFAARQRKTKTEAAVQYEKARVRVGQLATQRKLSFLGRVQLTWGRKEEKVFSTPGERVKKEWLRHDLLLWKWLRHLPNACVAAGSACDPAIRADAEITFSNGLLAFAEMDCETESLNVVKGRWDSLLQQQRWVLWIATSEERITRLKERAQNHPVSDRIFFARAEELVRHPGTEWEDCKGKRGHLFPIGG